jgi:hypothetical protein
MRFLPLTLMFFPCFLPEAAGQAGDPWFIVTTSTTADDSWALGAASSFHAELLERGVDVWSLQGAAARFEEKGSAPPAQATQTDIQQWIAQSTAAVEALVQGDPSSALDRLNEAQAFSRSVVEALNRDAEQSQRLLDTCLYSVRALLDLGSAARAEAQAQECRQLSPLGEPSPHMHPPIVLKVLEQVDAARATQSGALLVTSEPPRCMARLNGVPMGDTPVEIGHLFPGRYRVQVECEPDRPGRVHIAEVSGAVTEVLVDLRFDSAIETRPLLALRYASALDEEQYRDTDLAQVANAVPADHIVLMSMPNAEVIELELLTGAPLRRSALARVAGGPDGPSRGDMALAARALLEGECTDFTTLPPTLLACEEGAAMAEAPSKEGRPAARRPRGQLISGLTLFGAGSASLLTGYVLLGPRAGVAEDWVGALDAGGQGSASFQQKWFNMGTGIVVSSSAGAAALVAAMPLALPNRAKTPWWGWLSGGLGVGLAAFSIA